LRQTRQHTREIPVATSITILRTGRGRLPTHWESHIRSLKLYGVETHAFFSVPSAPQTVMALVSFEEHVDPEVVTRVYMKNDAFKEGMNGFDVAQIEGVETLVLKPGKGSPLT